jgi:hypothetical protein
MSSTLPNFVIAGAQLSATRWLRTNLEKHPDVYLPSFDLGYFENPTDMRRLGNRWYRDQFAAWDGQPHIGESSPSYFSLKHRPSGVARRIDENLPGVRVIVILREPVERMYSAMLQYIKRGNLEPATDLYELIRDRDPVLEHIDLLGASLYSQAVYRFRRRFGDRFLVLFLDDIRERPSEVYASVLRHLGARPFEPPHLDEVLFSNRHTVRAAELTEPQHRDLFRLFRRDVEELEALTDRDLSSWYPGPPRLTALTA